MKPNYRKQILCHLFALVLLNFISFNSFSLTKHFNKQKPSSSLVAAGNNLNLEWLPLGDKNIIVIASASNDLENPVDGNSYIADAAFKSGTACGNGFVVYKGNKNNVTITGLIPGTTYHFSIYEYNASGKFFELKPQFFISEKIIEQTSALKQLPSSPANATPVVCPPIAGITCTLNGTSSSGYLGAPAGCAAGSFAGTNPWDGGVSTGWISWSFSAPVSSTTLKSGSVNTNDQGTNVLTGGTGGTGSVSGLVCLTSVTGLVIKFFTGSCCGDVAWTVNSTGSFTNITLDNTGGQSGWIAECPSAITAGVLPVELVSFTGNCNASETVKLNWKTLTENNNNYFSVERSSDARNWEAIAKIAGAGNSSAPLNYSFTDTRSFHGLMYYRLKQTDLNGIYNYSGVIAVDNCGPVSLDEINFYPNPASQEIVLKVNSGNVSIDIFDVLGNKVATSLLNAGENKLNVSALFNGTYYFRLSNESSVSKMNKLLINH